MSGDFNLKVNPSPSEPRYTLQLKTVLSRSVGNWSGSAQFAIKYVTLFQQPRSSNLISWQLEVGVAF